MTIRKANGFALIDLIFVCGIIGLISSIALPRLVLAKQAAGAASAIGSLRTLNMAIETYAATYGKGIPPELAALGPSSGGGQPEANFAGLIDVPLASGLRSGYVFTYTVTGMDPDGFPNTYTITADPVKPGNTGRRHFFTDETGIIRAEQENQATRESPLIM